MAPCHGSHTYFCRQPVRPLLHASRGGLESTPSYRKSGPHSPELTPSHTPLYQAVSMCSYQILTDTLSAGAPCANERHLASSAPGTLSSTYMHSIETHCVAIYRTNGRTPVSQASAVGSNNQRGGSGACLSTCAVDRNVGRVCLQLHVSSLGLDSMSSLTIRTRKREWRYVIVHTSSSFVKMPKRQRISRCKYNHTILGIAASWARSFWLSRYLQEGWELLPSYCTCTFRSHLGGRVCGVRVDVASVPIVGSRVGIFSTKVSVSRMRL